MYLLWLQGLFFSKQSAFSLNNPKFCVYMLNAPIPWKFKKQKHVTDTIEYVSFLYLCLELTVNNKT